MSENALQRIEPMPATELEPRHAGPLDMEPIAFQAGLDRRKMNRNALMEWIRSALVENIDFGRIPTKRGPSKPSLFKPGAEKICGMLGIITTFPTLAEYEQASLKGIEIKSVVLRCALLDSRGIIVAEGVGARSLAQDYGDLNKALKMAEKSAHIDATLRMAGLSEVFTQDIEDMPKNRDIEPDKPGNANAGTPRGTATKGATEQQPKPAPPAQATEKTRAWFLSEMRKAFEDKVILQWGVDHTNPAYLLPHEHLEDWPLAHVPTSKAALEAKVRECAEFMGVEPAPQKPPTTQERAKSPQDDLKADTGASRDQNARQTAKQAPGTPQNASSGSADHHKAEWYNFPMPWGKKAGTILGKLEKNYLYGLWKNFTVETTYNGKPKKKETIEVDRTFRVMLDMAGVFYKFDEPKGGQDSDMGSDPTEGD